MEGRGADARRSSVEELIEKQNLETPDERRSVINFLDRDNIKWEFFVDKQFHQGDVHDVCWTCTR